MFNQTYHHVGTVVNVTGDFNLTNESSIDDLVRALKLVLEEAKNDQVVESAGAEKSAAVATAFNEAIAEAECTSGSKDTLVCKLNQVSEILSGLERTASVGWELAKKVKAIVGWAAVSLA